MTEHIRQFDSGATRDTVEGKLSYVRILSPIALRRYVEYMNFHAKQSDGTMREPDNWKSGFPIETYLDSLGRHLVAAWLLQQGFTETDNHGPVTLEDSLCGIVFNAMGWLHEILKEKPTEFVCPAGWVIRFYKGRNNNCGWYVCKKSPRISYLHQHGEYLHKTCSTLQLANSTGKEQYHNFGEAPGYWPTKEAAEIALQQYLEKKKKI